ncbi:MAG: phage tail tape measure protein [Tannerella sp.]|jgi:TP901 family phage tail tape measure protein|nr:phage tail tape measure protein [Tannerella sp.]
MADKTVKFTINIDGNAYAGVVKIDEAFKKLTTQAKTSLSFLERFGGLALKFNMISDAASKLRDTLNSAIQPGIDFDSSLRELSAITGVTGQGLQTIGQNARDAAKAFGIDATNAVRSYSLILSQLSPELAKNPEALKAMGDAAAVLSKSMGGDAAAATETLTTAMNQFGISLDNPMQASQEMADMMNVMSAAANVGSAELPQIKQALEQSGMSAKAAGVSFEELNAAIQVLDKAGKKGSEGGIAIRNVMNIISRGRFMDKKSLEALEGAGVNIEALGDKSASLTDRLRLLKPVMGDTALISKMFGMENQAAALALLDNLDVVDEYTKAVTGTNSAYEYAGTIMDSYAERQARIKARFDDLKISLFNATGSLGIWASTIASALVPLAQLMPALIGIGHAFVWVRSIKIKDTIATIMNSRAIRAAGIEYAFMRAEIMGAGMANIGFIKNVIRATWAIGRFATVGLFNAIKALVLMPFSLTAAGGAFGVFATTARVACAAISTAIHSIPIIGWIALAITAISALFVWLYNKCDGFRAVINGIGAALKAIFTGNWSQIGKSFTNAYEKTLADAKAASKKAEEDDPLAQIHTLEEQLKEEGAKEDAAGDLNITSTLNSNARSSAGDNKIKNINIVIETLIEKFTVQTTTVKESTAQIRRIVAEAIIEGINDVNLAY